MDENANPWKLAGGLTGLCFFILIGGVFFIANSVKPERVKPVSTFATFSAKDKSFACQYPQGWKSSTFESGATLSQAVFKQGGARIYVSADLQGSLMGDMMTAVGNMGGDSEGGEGGGSMPDLSGMPGMGGMAGGSDTRPVIDRLHEGTAPVGAEEAAGVGYGEEYAEQPAQPLPTNLGEGRISEFTADGGFFFGKGRGYRATILTSDKLLTVVCTAPDRDWATVSAAFKRSISSLSPAQ